MCGSELPFIIITVKRVGFGVDGLFDVCHGGVEKKIKNGGGRGDGWHDNSNNCMTTSRVCGIRERVYVQRYNDDDNNNNNISDYRLRPNGEKCHLRVCIMFAYASYGARDRRGTTSTKHRRRRRWYPIQLTRSRGGNAASPLIACPADRLGIK